MWKSSLDPCIEIGSLDIDVAGCFESHTLIKSRITKLKKLIVNNYRGNVNNLSLDVIAKET